MELQKQLTDAQAKCNQLQSYLNEKANRKIEELRDQYNAFDLDPLKKYLDSAQAAPDHLLIDSYDSEYENCGYKSLLDQHHQRNLFALDRLQNQLNGGQAHGDKLRGDGDKELNMKIQELRAQHQDDFTELQNIKDVQEEHDLLLNDKTHRMIQELLDQRQCDLSALDALQNSAQAEPEQSGGDTNEEQIKVLLNRLNDAQAKRAQLWGDINEKANRKLGRNLRASSFLVKFQDRLSRAQEEREQLLADVNETKSRRYQQALDTLQNQLNIMEAKRYQLWGDLIMGVIDRFKARWNIRRLCAAIPRIQVHSTFLLFLALFGLQILLYLSLLSFFSL